MLIGFCVVSSNSGPGHVAQLLSQRGDQSGAVLSQMAVDQRWAGRRVQQGTENGRDLVASVIEVGRVKVGVGAARGVYFINGRVLLGQKRQVQIDRVALERRWVDLPLRPVSQVDDSAQIGSQQLSPPPPAQKRQVGAADQARQGEAGVEHSVPVWRCRHGPACSGRGPDFAPRNTSFCPSQALE